MTGVLVNCGTFYKHILTVVHGLNLPPKKTFLFLNGIFLVALKKKIASRTIVAEGNNFLASYCKFHLADFSAS